MLVCSRQIGSALAASDLVNDLQSVRDLRALVLPMAAHQHLDAASCAKSGLGARGKWLAQAMPQLRTLLYLDPQMSIAAALGEEPWREAMELICQSLREAALGSALVGRVIGDDLVERLEDLLAAGCELANVDTGLPLREFERPVESMRVALGAAPFVHAATEGCRVVLAGTASLGAITMGFLYPDQKSDRRDWHALAQLALHAILAEQASLSIELGDHGIPTLHKAPWTPSDTPLDVPIRQALGQLGAVSELAGLYSPDVSFTGLVTNFEAGPFGGMTLSAIHGQNAPSELPVNIVYRAGFKTTLVASLASGGRLNELKQVAQQLATMFPLAQELEGREGVTTYFHHRTDDDSTTQRLSVELFSRSESTVVENYGVAYELLAKIPGCCFHTAPLPEVGVDYGRWPTRVPRELVEWDVEIRAAVDWT